jgi:hypothetical protein
MLCTLPPCDTVAAGIFGAGDWVVEAGGCAAGVTGWGDGGGAEAQGATITTIVNKVVINKMLCNGEKCFIPLTLTRDCEDFMKPLREFCELFKRLDSKFHCFVESSCMQILGFIE